MIIGILEALALCIAVGLTVGAGVGLTIRLLRKIGQLLAVLALLAAAPAQAQGVYYWWNANGQQGVAVQQPPPYVTPQPYAQPYYQPAPPVYPPPGYDPTSPYASPESYYYYYRQGGAAGCVSGCSNQ